MIYCYKEIIFKKNYARNDKREAMKKRITANYLASKLLGKETECSQEIIDFDEVHDDELVLSDSGNIHMVRQLLNQSMKKQSQSSISVEKIASKINSCETANKPNASVPNRKENFQKPKDEKP
ncbi:hypothetical protein BpHYR1_021574 [Brachionus plicatilis]|uniref:Uncharacterized protein n=1 Tax=Brachionus plicatilis TaxID=10195 RepID=A0A3M7S6G6_BRAPC|nr:hypothetical protein BpHYR1_021574 [Brachionus plicatilis]